MMENATAIAIACPTCGGTLPADKGKHFNCPFCGNLIQLDFAPAAKAEYPLGSASNPIREKHANLGLLPYWWYGDKPHFDKEWTIATATLGVDLLPGKFFPKSDEKSAQILEFAKEKFVLAVRAMGKSITVKDVRITGTEIINDGIDFTIGTISMSAKLK